MPVGSTAGSDVETEQVNEPASESVTATPPPTEADTAGPVPTERRRLRPLAVLQGVSVLLVLALLALLIWKVAFANSGGRLVSKISHGQRPVAPPFRLKVIWSPPATWPKPLRKALDDHVVSLYELRGYPVVINFWASWCVPCKDEAPFLDASARAHAGRVVFLGIDVQDLIPDAHKFLRELRVPYPSVRDGSPKTYSAYGLTGVPETYYLDRRPHRRAFGRRCVTP